MDAQLNVEKLPSYNIVSRDKIISLLLKHSEEVWRAGKNGQHFRQVMSDQDIATLINALQEYHHVLEMQNDELKRLEAQAEKAKINQQKAILSAMFTAQEKERYKISRTLHDSICQLLYGIRLNLQSLSVYKENSDDFQGLNQLLDQAIEETRQISYELRPSILIDFGFIEGINEMASRLTTAGFSVRSRISSQANKLNPTVQLHVFRIIQELISNSIKHANARNAEINLRMNGKRAVLTIRDDGVGFRDDVSVALRNGSGLRSIKNQLVLLNGTLEIDSTDTGATIGVLFEDIEL